MGISWFQKAKGAVFPKLGPIVNAVHLQGMIAARSGPRGMSFASLEQHLGTPREGGGI